MLSGIGMWAGGILVGIVAKQVIPKWWNKLAVKLRKDVKSKAEQYLKDPEWLAIVSKIVLKVQKEAAEAANEKKLKMAVDWLCKFSPLPDSLERPIYECMVELVIEQVKIPIEL